MDEQAPSNRGLFCRNLTKSYGKIKVLKSADLSLYPGEVTAVVGENGAGKSTLNLMIAGVVAPSSGQMWLDGVVFAPHSPMDALAQGVALIHQEMRLLPDLSVAENLFLGRLPMRRGRIDRKSMASQASNLLASLGVEIDPHRSIRGLSVAVQQSIEIAKALLRQPRYVIFDEPTASLGEREAERIFEQIRKLKAADVGILYVSHRLSEIQLLADQIICLRDGELVAEWRTMPVEKQDMINAMIGRKFAFEYRTPPPSRERIVLKAHQISRKGIFENISLEVMEGEILGLAGLVGSGRSDVVRALAGVDLLDEGEVFVAGERVQFKSPKDAIEAGVVMVSEDRKGLGLHLDRAAADNITLPWEKTLTSSGLIFPAIVGKIAQEQKRRFDIRGAMNLPVGAMSGGNQQKVLLAKWLIREPKVFIIDEPTRGVDIGAKMAIYAIISNLAARGVAVIVVSSELEEILGLSHRILVMSKGRSRGVLSREEATPEHVMTLAFGD